jgi:hypothetical protein
MGYWSNNYWGGHGVAAVGTSQPALIAAQIASLMGGVSGIGSIHARIRRPVGATDADFTTLYKSSGTVNAWEIHEESMPSEWATTDKAWLCQSTFRLEGFYAFSDTANSDGTFRAIIQGISAALNGDQTLGGTCQTHTTVQMRQYGHSEHSGALLHAAILAITCSWYHQP